MPPRRQKSFLLPLAVGATAAAASLALWYILRTDDQERRQHSGHESGDERSRARGRRGQDTPHPSNPSYANPPEPQAPQASQASQGARSTPTTTTTRPKKNICLILSESPRSQLLSHIPPPLPLDTTNIFILIHSPFMTALIPAGKPAEIVMPYTNELSLVAMLKQLRPETVYIEAQLVGEDAGVVSAVLEGAWVGGVIIAVEDSLTGQRLADATGVYGKRCRVLDVDKAGEDWGMRVG
ncbi:hypothetical protein BZA77DRAFT_358290 [Pyronema omphalodes]|nr:hypothetical protein BZA77DRAFT_358290 [Pyronema omphalodes]